MSFTDLNKKQSGVTLLELLLVCVIISASIFLIYSFLKPSLLNAGTKREQTRISSLSEAIVTTYGRTQGHYGALSMGSLQLNQVPGAEVTGTGSELSMQSRLGDPITVRPATIRKSNDAFDIIYSELDSKKCQKYIRAFQLPAFNVIVGSDQTAVKQVAGASSGSLVSDEQILTACLAPEFKANNGQVAFRFFESLADGDGTANPPVCGCSPQTQFRNTDCGPGQIGSFSEKRTSTCDGGTPECPQANWSAWQIVTNTCTGGSVPLGTDQTATGAGVSECFPRNEVSVSNCVDAATGTTVPGYVRFVRQVTCSSATSPEVYGPWASVSNTCQFPPPPPVCTPTTETRIKADSSGVPLSNNGCPMGMNGYKEESRSSTCPSVNSLPVWSDWVDTSNKCTNDKSCHPTIHREERDCPTDYSGKQHWLRRFDCIDPDSPRTDTDWILERDECVPDVPLTVNGLNECSPDYTYSYWGYEGSYVSKSGWRVGACIWQMGFPHYRIRFNKGFPEAYSEAVESELTWVPFTKAELDSGKKGSCFITWSPTPSALPQCENTTPPDVNDANNGMCYGGTTVTSAFLHAFFHYDGTYSISAGVYSPIQWIVDSTNGVVASGTWKDGTGVFNPADYSVSFVGTQPQGDGGGGQGSVTLYPNKGGSLDQTRELRWDDGNDADSLTVKGYFSVKKNGTEIKQIPVDVLLSAFVECP